MDSELEQLRTENEQLKAELNRTNAILESLVQTRDSVLAGCEQLRIETEGLIAKNEKLQVENAIARALIERVDAMSTPKPKKRHSKGFGHAYKP